MDYAVQLLTIIGLFLFGGLWLHDNKGMPMWGVVVFFFAGVIIALGILYKRSVEESRRAEEVARSKAQDAAEKPVFKKLPSSDEHDGLLDLNLLPSDDEEKPEKN